MGLRLAKRLNETPLDLEQVVQEMQLLSPHQLAEAKLKAANLKLPLERVLPEQGYISDADMAKLYSKLHQLELVDLSRSVPTPEAIAKIPGKVAVKMKVVPYGIEDGKLFLALAHPNEIPALEQLGNAIGLKLDFKFAPLTQIDDSLARFYPLETKAPGVGSTVKPQGQLVTDDTHARPFKKIVFKDDAKASVEGLINEIIEGAISHRASDVHIEPDETLVRIRCRIDGILQEIGTLKIDIQAQLISRLKVLAGLDIAEKRNAQDGSFQHTIGTKAVDLRLSTLPTIRGEKAVLRILDKSVLKVRLDDLGMTNNMLQITKRVLDSPHGLILVTGPTGSGKTTTVYSMLQHMNSIESNIITVEDPVEFQFSMINQVQVNARAGLTFASVLRNILRQDPDIIMVGEIRDKETAELAIRAAITGHLVISTIHTNDSLNTVSRLIDMGIEPFMISSAIVGIFSQRLVRTLCTACKQPRQLSKGELSSISPAFGTITEGTIYESSGCPRCNNNGYHGRHPIYELLAPSVAFRKAVAANRSQDELLQILGESGFRTLRDDGVDRVLKGQTTLDEVLKATV